MSKTGALWKASFLQLRIYLWCVAGFAAASVLSNVIVMLSLGGGNDDSKQLSAANVLTVLLIIIAIVLPTSFFKRVINLGATRKEYYVGVLIIYSVWAAFFSLLNIIFHKQETGWLANYQESINILAVFHWDQFGVFGMFVYQFGAYMLIISILNMLHSGLKHFTGWVLWAVVITAIPVGTSIASLRHEVAYGLKQLLFNDSLLQGFGLTFLLSCLFLGCGWLFVRRRSF